MLKILALLSWFVTSPIFAQGYEAKYDVVWNMGIKLEAEAIETLKQTGDLFEMVLDANASIGSATETTSLLFTKENGWRPLDYSYTQNILGRATGRNFRFNWNRKSLARLHEPERAGNSNSRRHSRSFGVSTATGVPIEEWSAVTRIDNDA